MEDRYLLHIRERCSWPRITRQCLKCLHNALLHPVAAIESNPGLPSPSHSCFLRVRLQPFERLLLSKTISQLRAQTPHLHPSKDALSDIEATRVATILFYHWSWADNVLRMALTELDPEWVAECHDRNFATALDIFQSTLRTRTRERNDLYDRRWHRTAQLMRDNAGLEGWGAGDYERLTAVPCEEDWELWKELGRMIFREIKMVMGIPGFGGEVLKLLGLVGNEKDLLECVEHLIEDTPEFPPKGLFEGMEHETSDTNDADAHEDGNVGDNEHAMDPEEKQAKMEQGRERTTDWARMTAIKITEAEDLWDVWSLSRMLMVSEHNARYGMMIDKFIATPEFSGEWVARDNPNGARTFFAKQPLTMVLSQRPSEIANLFFQEDAQEFLELELRRKIHESPIVDLTKLLPFYPWEMLENIDARSLSELESGLGLNAAHLSEALCTVSADRVNHSLYLTDDLFPPHIDAGYRYPGLTVGESVVFHKQKIKDTNIIKNLRYVSAMWNDCALTYDPGAQAFHLLQTLPGLKMRQFEKRSGFWAAIAFFDLRFRHRETLDSQHVALKEILGEHYDPAYSDFLHFVDARELDLADLSRDSLLGQGSFGNVYRAKWARKPTTRYDHTEEGQGNVALKVARVKRSFDDQAKFFVELATVYSALAGDSSGCVPFYGFCKVRVDEEGNVLDSNSKTASQDISKETFALVFDYADQGDILSFLNKRLKPGEQEENWLLICSALNGLATGLMTIHKKGVVHRDIHPRNVLVSSIQSAGDGEIEFDCLLSDLGEGKDINTSAEAMDAQSPAASTSTSQGTYSYTDFMMPGSIAQRSYSSAADDIFAWGLLAVRIIQNEEVHSRLCDEDGKVLYLAGLMRIMEHCLDPDPAGRFDANSLVVVMEELIDGPSGLAASAYGGEIEWYDESYQLPRIRKVFETGSGLSLGSDWLPLSSRKRKSDSMLEAEEIASM